MSNDKTKTFTNISLEQHATSLFRQDEMFIVYGHDEHQNLSPMYALWPFCQIY